MTDVWSVLYKIPGATASRKMLLTALIMMDVLCIAIILAFSGLIHRALTWDIVAAIAGYYGGGSAILMIVREIVARHDQRISPGSSHDTES
jgi:uncharacterized membrane protein